MSGTPLYQFDDEQTEREAKKRKRRPYQVAFAWTCFCLTCLEAALLVQRYSPGWSAGFLIHLVGYMAIALVLLILVVWFGLWTAGEI